MSESNKRIKMTTRPSTIEFDVGGTVYKVSKSLLDMFPDTMLASLASPRWNQHSEQAEADSTKQKPIFIDRNGERFQYVLDYMRDNGTVNLPATISQDAVINDLEYLGFENVKTVGTFNVFYPSTRNLFDALAQFNTFFLQKDEKLRIDEEKVRRERSCLGLAKICFGEVLRYQTLAVCVEIERKSLAYDAARKINAGGVRWEEDFDSFLKEVGLKLSLIGENNCLYIDSESERPEDRIVFEFHFDHI